MTQTRSGTLRPMRRPFRPSGDPGRPTREWSLQSVSSNEGAWFKGYHYTFIHNGDEVNL